MWLFIIVSFHLGFIHLFIIICIRFGFSLIYDFMLGRFGSQAQSIYDKGFKKIILSLVILVQLTMVKIGFIVIMRIKQ